MTISIPSEAIAPRFPGKIKDQEKERINPAYFNLSDEKYELIADVPYMWILTEDEKFIIGVEDIWNHPEVCVDPADLNAVTEFNKLFPPESRELLGHPTLAYRFGNDGELFDKTVYIGGELKLTEGKLYIDNKSGRYGRFTSHSYLLQKLMHHAAKLFENLLDIKTIVKCIESAPNQSPYLAEYYKVWSSSSNKVAGALALLETYCPSEFKTFMDLNPVAEGISFFSPIKKSFSLDKIIDFLAASDIRNDETDKILQFIAGATDYSIPQMVFSKLEM